MRLNRNSVIDASALRGKKPVENAVAMLRRDMDKVLAPTTLPGGTIRLTPICAQAFATCEGQSADEAYTVTVDAEGLTVCAAGELGFVYGLLRISAEVLGVKPFWFWMDQRLALRESVELAPCVWQSPRYAVRFRGWFFNDEVLFMKWPADGSGETCWRMGFEALLRCGGNMVIPGTDKNARQNRVLAAEMGLWLTHHHAEPLGAEMFVRAYPGIAPNFSEHPELFYKLWEDAVREQKDYKVVWNLCFRGQGDCPFWATDTTGRYDTPEKQGALIGELIKKQCDIVRQYVENPVFCTNLYGEVMELYKAGWLRLDPAIIKVRADNGYGRMVTRRRDGHAGRVDAMPDPADKGAQGIYYHVSFYDLQAANHITMLPNSVSFVAKELDEVQRRGGGDFWVINCSNVKPHAYYLDAVRRKWLGETVDDARESHCFAADYFGGSEAVAACYAAAPAAVPAYGREPDEHAGEQFYNESVRLLAHQLCVDRESPAASLFWLTGRVSLAQQIETVCGICEKNADALAAFAARCDAAEGTLAEERKALFDASIGLYAKLHLLCSEGVRVFGRGFVAFAAGDCEKAFVRMGDAAACFAAADAALRASEYGVWRGFYQNDCFADCKHTAYMLRKLMGLVRELGDNARHDKWYRKYCYAPADQNVFLLLVTDNHMTDEALYAVMKPVIDANDGDKKA